LQGKYFILILMFSSQGLKDETFGGLS